MASCWSVAFCGLEPRAVEIQCQVMDGAAGFAMVGLPDKAVAESKERVRAALSALGLSLPNKRVVLNLAPADLPKEGAHYDLPVAIALLAALGAIPEDEASRVVAMGELALDGRLVPVGGALLGAISAAAEGRSFVCPSECGAEAALAGAGEVLAPPSLTALVNHYAGRRPLAAPPPAAAEPPRPARDMADIKGQEKARRALEVAAAGGHNMLLIGPPGVGKSMLAEALPGILPPLSPAEALEVSMIRSLKGRFAETGLARLRPFEKPHSGASVASVIGGGRFARPGSISLAHRGVLFLDEMAEFARPVLDGLRQPMESGECVIARAQAQARYPARFQLIGAMNPCRCGHLADAGKACSRAPKCGEDYLSKLSGPLLDRIDLQVETPPIPAQTLARLPRGEASAQVAARVAAAREIQAERWAEYGVGFLNAHADGLALEEAAAMDDEARDLLARAAQKLALSPRGMTRVLRLSRTVADLYGEEGVRRPHIAEAVGYRAALSKW
ncbi:YifB family Mg chelatase-like AAA ATPase [Rhodovulum sp. DZ06]|uniref:YifB family Mg chelatase-like AAA ATPase n=1 Tax=Rhodovulum sp. DZ06 TaxID=3425126 RepID=UPI003D335E94